MKAYQIIQGNTQALDAFEKKVADALEMGYVLGSDLVVHSQGSELKLFQSLILPEEDFDEDEED